MFFDHDGRTYNTQAMIKLSPNCGPLHSVLITRDYRAVFTVALDPAQGIRIDRVEPRDLGKLYRLYEHPHLARAIDVARDARLVQETVAI